MKINKKENLILILIAISLFVVSVLGVTYAYFNIIVVGNEDAKDIIVTTASLKLKYIDGPEVTITSAYPGAYIEKEVKVENIGSVPVSYAIGLIGVVDTFVNDELVISYTCRSYKNYGEENQYEYKTCSGLEEMPIDKDNPGLEEGITIGVGVTQVYQIKIEFKETNSNQNSNQGATFSGAINIGESLNAFMIVLEVVDENGDPVSGTGEIHSKVRRGQIDENGILELPMVSVGDHTLVIKDEDGNELLRKSINVQTAPIAEVNGDTIKVESGTEEVVVRVQITREATLVSMIDYPRLVVALNGGVASQSIPERMENGTSLELINPTKEGYVFAGWIVDGKSELKGKTLTMEEETGLIATWKEETPLTSFEYDTNYQGISKPHLGLNSADNIVVLTKYIGNSVDVVVPSTYEINGETYKVVMYNSNCFKDTTIESILYEDNIKFIGMAQGYVVHNSFVSAFENLTTLKRVYNIPEGISNMTNSFIGCTNLEYVSNIPDSVINMVSTFGYCRKLEESPILSKNVTSLNSAFYGCSSLVKAPVIPTSVTTMSYTFAVCTSLKEAPIIPSNVTNMSNTFTTCYALEGNIRIESENVSNVTNTFRLVTAKNINLYVKSGSTTYNNFLNSNLTSNFTINQF